MLELNDILEVPLIINLDKDVKRWNDICDHLSQWNIVPERFSAVHGIKLPENSLNFSMKEHGYTLNLNLSHSCASRYRLFYSNKPFWLIMEDDCRFTENPKSTILNIIAHLELKKIDWSVVSLGCFSYENQAKSPDIPSEYMLTQPHNWFPWGTHAYIVNRKHAARLIAEWGGCFYPPDHTLLSEYNKKNGFLLRPSLAYQEEYASYACDGNSIMSTKNSADIPQEIKDKISLISPYSPKP